MIDARDIIESTEAEHAPITVAVYTVQIVMNEDRIGSFRDEQATDEILRRDLAQEFQRALDDGYFMHLRYDALDFDVVSRIPIATKS